MHERRKMSFSLGLPSIVSEDYGEGGLYLNGSNPKGTIPLWICRKGIWICRSPPSSKASCSNCLSRGREIHSHLSKAIQARDAKAKRRRIRSPIDTPTPSFHGISIRRKLHSNFQTIPCSANLLRGFGHHSNLKTRPEFPLHLHLVVRVWSFPSRRKFCYH